MKEMLRFPLFISLNGKKAVVIGGGTVALRRAAVLADFGAVVTIVAPEIGDAPAGASLHRRPYETGDLEGAFLAVAATDDPAVNSAVGREARERGVWFNRSDDPADCDFFFPAICRSETLVAGLVGTGADHHKTAQAAKKVRILLEEIK